MNADFNDGLNERLALIADAAGIGLWTRDIGTGRLHWSAANRLLYGLAPDDALPTWAEYLEHFVHPEDRERFAAEAAQADRAGRPVRHHDYRVRAADGRERWIYSWASREWRDGRHYGFGVNVDVTDRHAVELERRERERAEQARRAQSALLARVSHELRTPMNAVLGFAELMASDPRQRLSAEQAQRLAHIRGAGQHLLSLIDDLLGLAAADAEERVPDWQPVPLAVAAAQALPWVQSLAEAHEVQLHVEQPLPGVVRADPRWLRQVASNLLSNAVKYNRRGGWVRVASAARERDGLRQWALVVHDSGRGLDGEQQQRLFEPFERLGADAEGIGGHGLGLAVVRRLVERMGGEIGVDSTPGVGSAFSVWLPAAAEQPAPAPETPPETLAVSTSTPAPRVLQVLCIEDNATNRALIQGLFGMRPRVSLHMAEDGSSGLAMAQVVWPDVVLLDMQLPDLPGTEVARRLRADPRLAGCTVIGLSAHALAEDRALALQAGCDDYWTKPIDVAGFLAGIDALAASGQPAIGTAAGPARAQASSV